jgi:hypothetical protein
MRHACDWTSTMTFCWLSSLPISSSCSTKYEIVCCVGLLHVADCLQNFLCTVTTEITWLCRFRATFFLFFWYWMPQWHLGLKFQHYMHAVQVCMIWYDVKSFEFSILRLRGWKNAETEMVYQLNVSVCTYGTDQWCYGHRLLWSELGFLYFPP